MAQPKIRLRALEKSDLAFVHDLNNNRRVMNYWFEEPYESYLELADLYLKHIHDQSERRFIAEDKNGDPVGLVELVEISYIHRRAEFQIVIAPLRQGEGCARPITMQALDYAFRVLNLNKVYLVVSTENSAAIHVYRECGFTEEGELIEEFFVNGAYQDAIRMYLLQGDFLAEQADKRAIH